MVLAEGTWNNYLEISRYSNELYDGEIIEVELHSEFGDEFPDSAQIHVTLDSKQTGTIYLNGSATETLAFNNRNFDKGSELFESLDGVTPSDELSGTMLIEIFDEQGHKIEKLAYKENAWCDFEIITDEIKMHNVGILPDWYARLRVNSDTDIRLEDRVSIDGSDDYEVMKVLPIKDRGLDLYKEIYIK